jgi:Ion channel
MIIRGHYGNRTKHICASSQISQLLSGAAQTQRFARIHHNCVRGSPLIGDSGAGAVLFGVALVLLLLAALYNINVDEMVVREVACSPKAGGGAAWVGCSLRQRHWRVCSSPFSQQVHGVMVHLHPDSFGNLAAATPGRPVDVLHVFPVLNYFSLTTLSTIGFGDITLYKRAMRRSPRVLPDNSTWQSWLRD